MCIRTVMQDLMSADDTAYPRHACAGTVVQEACKLMPNITAQAMA